jgi:hypothetical protein
MQIGDIIFVRGNTPISHAIRYFDKGQFSHVAICVSSTTHHILEAQYGTRCSIVPFHFDDYKIVPLNLSEDERNKLVHYGIELTGQRYGYEQITWYLFESLFKLNRKHIWNSPNNLICAEVIAILLWRLNKIADFEYGFVKNMTVNELYFYLSHRFR